MLVSSNRSVFDNHVLIHNAHLQTVVKLYAMYSFIIPVSCRTEARTMASYFDEHDCEPTNPEEQYRQNALLELAR